MHSSRALAVASVAGCLLLGADGFAPLTTPKTFFNTLAPRSTSSRTVQDYHDLWLSHCSLRAPRYATTHHRDSVLMAAGGSKKRKRRKSTAMTSSGTGAVATRADVPATRKLAVSGRGTVGKEDMGNEADGGVAGLLGDVLQGDRSVEALFSDDWSGMQANTGMVKSKMELPDISTYVPKNRPEAETLEQRRKKSAVGLTIGVVPPEKEKLPNPKDFKSKLPPLVDREQEAYAKRAAERFEEGPIVKALKTATWFAICALVAWEIYINSPWFPGAPKSPLSP